ncbi:hypothetical protein LtaPh_0302800 [Leishmania tarentolae]|uniref:Rubicon Homology domain-containing protein n=1 Tax=Leishmania tarentolae TaxID=5689 RepID=A0A640K7J4_LEITA|nr:hypothetical protein LtaPh_0302800 [Leishmania tarentolae]
MQTAVSGDGYGGHDGPPANGPAASAHPPPIANVCHVLEQLVQKLQQQNEVVACSPVGEARQASVDDRTPTHPALPIPCASIPCSGVAYLSSSDMAQQQCERRRLLFLAEWAQRLANAYAPIPPSAVQGAAVSLPVVEPVSDGMVTRDAAETAVETSPTVPTEAQRRRTEPAVTAAAADAAMEKQASTFTSETKADLPPVRYASVPVERRLSYPSGCTNEHPGRAALASATTHSALLPLPRTVTTAAAAMPCVSSPPPPIIPRGRAPLCRVVGEPFDVPVTRAAQRAVLAAQGGCCARCGVVLPALTPHFCEWVSAHTRRICTKMTGLSHYLQCCHRGSTHATTSSPHRGRLWRACLCMWRCSSSDEGEENGRPAAIAVAHVTQEAITRTRGDCGGLQHSTTAPLSTPVRKNVGDEEDISDASECDGLLGRGTQSPRHRRPQAARHRRCSAPLIASTTAPQVSTQPTVSEPTALGHRCGDKTGGSGGGRPADAPFLFCTYEGRYLCLRCFHAPLTAAGLGAATSPASVADGGATDGTFIPQDYQTRYVAPREWQEHASLTTASSLSSACAAPARPSVQLQEWWLARHVAHPTPTVSTLTTAESRTTSGLHRPSQQQHHQHTASPVHLCVLPAHVLHRWEFTRFPVSAAVAAALQGRCYAGSAHGRHSFLSPRGSSLERDRPHTTLSGAGVVTKRMTGERSPMLLTGEPQVARGQPNASATPPSALEHLSYLGEDAGGAAPPMVPLPELYDVSAINPSLYARVPALASALRLRQRMSLLHAQAWWCPRYRLEVWGLLSGSEPAGQPLERVTALSVAQQLPAPPATVEHASQCPSRPAAVMENAVGSAGFSLLTQDVAHPPHSTGVSSSPSRSHSVATPQAALPSLSQQVHSNLSGGVDGVPSPHQHHSTAGVAAAPLMQSTCARIHARRRYLVERAEGWSLQDLYRLATPPPPSPTSAGAAAASPPSLLAELRSMFDTMQAHLSGCSSCAAQCRVLMVNEPLGLLVCRD